MNKKLWDSNTKKNIEAISYTEAKLQSECMSSKVYHRELGVQASILLHLNLF